MKKLSLIYGVALAAGAFVLQWLEQQFALQLYSTEIYIILLAMLFTALGIWVGTRFSHRPADSTFKKNTGLIRSLGISNREYQVLMLLAKGHSNQEIAEQLFVSRSTIKTHLIHLYQKLDVSRRTQAVDKAKSLQIIP